MGTSSNLRIFHFTIDLFLFFIGTVYVIIVPYTKVEESFNMQASHDMLFYGYTNIQNYDHNEFPGVVPRTFIGSLILSLMVYPFKLTMEYIFKLFFISSNLNIYLIKIICQYLIRCALLFINIASLSYFRQSFISNYILHKNKQIICVFSIIFTLLISSQFHFLFYSSRLLPNCFALPCVIISFALYFNKKTSYHKSLQWLAASTIIFRCDTIIIAFPLIIIMFIRGINNNKYKLHFIFKFIYHGILASIFSILLSIVIDSWFWNQWNSIKWPEFEVLIYNTYYNKSSDWGISPWNEYFMKHIPKMLLITLLFIPFSFIKINPILFIRELIDRYYYQSKFNKSKYNKNKNSFWKLCFTEFADIESILIFLICFIFIFLYSFLPHKETRFIFFIIAPATLLSTIGFIRLLTFWGLNSISNSFKYKLTYYYKHLYRQQSSCFYIWISNNYNIFNKQFCCLFLFIFISFIITFIGIFEASYNYPGGYAMKQFTSSIMQQNQCKYDNLLNNINNNNEIFLYYNEMKCVHIGNYAAMTGITRFITPSYCDRFRFNKMENIVLKEDYLKQYDPCNISKEMYEICSNKNKNDKEQCNAIIQYGLKKGFDFLISEYKSVNGYKLVENGVIYAKQRSLIGYILELLTNGKNQQFLMPTLYILQKE